MLPRYSKNRQSCVHLTSTIIIWKDENNETRCRRERPVGLAKLKWMKSAAVVVVHFATIWASASSTTSSTASTTATSFFHRDDVIRNQRFGRYRILLPLSLSLNWITLIHTLSISLNRFFPLPTSKALQHNLSFFIVYNSSTWILTFSD